MPKSSGIFQRMHTFFTEEPEDTPLPDTFAKTVENPEGVLFHLNELRKHLLRAVVVLALMTGLAFTFAARIIDIIAQPVGGIEGLHPIDITEPVGVFMRVALLTGFTFALPYIAFEAWLFVAPGISARSRRWGLLTIPVATLLFAGGMAFAYFVLLPVAIPFLLNFLGMTPQIRPLSYIGFNLSLMFWIGLAFEFPLVIYILASLGIVNAQVLRSQWRLAVVVIAILAALITPTTDPVNMSITMGPMIILYILSIGLAALAGRVRSANSS